MADFLFNNIAIKGIACAVPKTEVSVEDYIPVFGEDAVLKFKKMTGVNKIHCASVEQTASDLGFVAARELFKFKEIDPKTIGALIFVSQTPDYKLPSSACVLHKRLGLPKECIAFDINLGCSGYVYGLQTIFSCLQTSNINRALLIVGDTLSKVISPEDRSAAMLFGDAGAATLIEKDDNALEIEASYRTDGEGYRSIIIQGNACRNPNSSKERSLYGDGNMRSDNELYMNGTDVFNFTISEVPEIINSFINRGNTYDSFILHQANVFILKQISRKCKIPIDKLPVSMDRYGNTSVSSIPLTLCDVYGNKSNEYIRTLLCGFGVGLSWGQVDLRIQTDDILPIIETDEYYTEGGIRHD